MFIEDDKNVTLDQRKFMDYSYLGTLDSCPVLGKMCINYSTRIEKLCLQNENDVSCKDVLYRYYNLKYVIMVRKSTENNYLHRFSSKDEAIQYLKNTTEESLSTDKFTMNL